MTDTTVVTDAKEKKEEIKEKSLGQEVREKSFQQILTEEKVKPKEEQAPTHTPELDEKAKEDERLATEAQEAKAKIEADEADRKRVAELAATAATEVVKKQREEEEARKEKEKEIEAAKQREEALKPKFTGVDEKGNVVPKSYEEIASESARIAREKTLEEVEQRDKAKEAKLAEENAKKAKSAEEQKAAEKAYTDQLQKELDTDLKDLYLNNKLPKIKNKDDENDPGNKEFRHLFETAQKVNAERMAKGEAPIRSIKLIYYEHYKPLSAPAGHDAPVLGNESPLSHEPPEDRYVPSRDRHKSMAQLVKEEAIRLSRKLNVRGA